MKVTYKLKLPKQLSASLKEDIAQYVLDQIVRDCNAGVSSVDGQRWQGLSKDYKEYKLSKVGSGRADLQLEGDMLGSLAYKVVSDGVEIGVFGGDEALKADNHNKFSGESMLTSVPQRQFIPNADEGQTFRPGIMKEINRQIRESFELSGRETSSSEAGTIDADLASLVEEINNSQSII